MASSDDDWLPSSKPPGLSTTDHMTARSRAIQEERMARAARRGENSHVGPFTQSPSPSGPLDFLDNESSDPGHRTSHGTAASKSSVATIHTKGSSETTNSEPNKFHETMDNSLDALRLRVAEKKKFLASLREKERLLLEKYRCEKAHKKAETAQVEAQIRAAWSRLEDEKRSAESKVREASLDHETALRNARRRVESEVKETYDSQINAMQERLNAMRDEEKKLKDLLLLEGEAKGVVESAVAAATSAVAERVHLIFTESAADTAEWNAEVEKLVRHEVEASFSVSASCEAQSEREDLQKQFTAMLELWRNVEQEERECLVKMDDSLLADFQQMAQNDLNCLQREEGLLEEVYTQSREAWAEQHQHMLNAEQHAALERREDEFNEQRRLRDAMHAERIAAIEARHTDNMKAEEARHEKEMKMLREQLEREEQIAEAHRRTLIAAQEDVVVATQSFDTIGQFVDEILQSLKGFQRSVMEKKTLLDEERRDALSHREASLHALKELVASQRSCVEAQHAQLLSTASQLATLESKVSSHLQEEESWLVHQEAKCAASREKWKHEYHRWLQIVEAERTESSQTFSAAQSALRECVDLLNAEVHDVSAEMSGMRGVFSDLAAETEKQVGVLQSREAQLEKRQGTVKSMLNAAVEKGATTAAKYQDLQEQRQRLGAARTKLKVDMARVRDFSLALEVMKSQTQTYQQNHSRSKAQCEKLRHELDRQKQNRRASEEPRQRLRSQHASRHSMNGLPKQVISQLQQELQLQTGHYAAVDPPRPADRPVAVAAPQIARYEDPEKDLPSNSRTFHEDHTDSQSAQTPTQLSSDQTNTTFTNLITISDNSGGSQ